MDAASGIIGAAADARQHKPEQRYARSLPMFIGQCLCGAVQYSSAGPALFSAICHCRDCQRASGSGGVPVLGVPKASFSHTGPVKQSRVIGGSGLPTARNFCAECGSLLFGTPESAPEMVTIYAGSLNDASSFAPTDALFVSQRPAWATLALPMAEHDALPQPQAPAA